MGVEKTGDWTRVRNMIRSIKPLMRETEKEVLVKWGLHAEKTAVTHMSLQDLGWKPLKAATVAANIRKGESTQILIATSDYFQSITSYVKEHTAYAGVKSEVRNKEGELIANIAKIHEFGSRSGNTPARPLWQPTFNETMAWTQKNNNPVDVFLRKIRAL